MSEHHNHVDSNRIQDVDFSKNVPFATNISMTMLSNGTLSLLKSLAPEEDLKEKNQFFEPTLKLINHVTDCIGGLREIVNIYKGKDAAKIFNSFTSILGKLLISTLTTEWAGDGPDSSLSQLVCDHIIKVFPEMISKKHKKTGKMLIHHICLDSNESSGHNAIRTIFGKFPSCAQAVDSLGFTPLHWALQNDHPSLQMVQELINAYPQAVQVSDKNGLLPLHWASQKESLDPRIFKLLIESYPEASSVESHVGSFPLHYAANCAKPSLESIKMLLSIFPDAVKKQNSNGYLPVELLFSHPLNQCEIFGYLFEQYPACVQHKDRNGQLLLHRIVDQVSLADENLGLGSGRDPSLTKPQTEVLTKIFDMIFNENKEASRVTDQQGYTPLHIALDSPYPDDYMIDSLIRVYPEAAKITTVDNFLPLHFTIGSQVNPNPHLVQTLIDIYPDAAQFMVTEEVPADKFANPSTWKGRWKKKKWTPYSKAVDRKLDEIVPILAAHMPKRTSGFSPSSVSIRSSHIFTTNQVDEFDLGQLSEVIYDRDDALAQVGSSVQSDFMKKTLPLNLQPPVKVVQPIAFEDTEFRIRNHSLSPEANLHLTPTKNKMPADSELSPGNIKSPFDSTFDSNASPKKVLSSMREDEGDMLVKGLVKDRRANYLTTVIQPPDQYPLDISSLQLGNRFKTAQDGTERELLPTMSFQEAPSRMENVLSSPSITNPNSSFTRLTDTDLDQQLSPKSVRSSRSYMRMEQHSSRVQEILNSNVKSSQRLKPKQSAFTPLNAKFAAIADPKHCLMTSSVSVHCYIRQALLPLKKSFEVFLKASPLSKLEIRTH